jgi:hypothetical protein
LAFFQDDALASALGQEEITLAYGTIGGSTGDDIGEMFMH